MKRRTLSRLSLIVLVAPLLLSPRGCATNPTTVSGCMQQAIDHHAVTRDNYDQILRLCELQAQ